jgi:pimeloyl-ACP methyl ester carboxylesterase
MTSIEADVEIWHGQAMSGPGRRLTIAVTEQLRTVRGVMMTFTKIRSRTAGAFGSVGLLGLLLTFPLLGAAAAHGDPMSAGPKPTIVLVHGGWADASSWNAVTQRLQDDGYTVIAPAVPLRGVQTDSAYLSSVLATITGPIVLVGHSYGGALITNAATGNPNVKALVYVAAFAPDLGETVGQILAMNPGSQAAPPNLTFRPYPGGADVYITTSAFHSVFCADLPAKTAAVMAANQRPIEAAALGEPSGEPAWKTIPSWYLVASNDQAIPPATERFMAKRADATTVEIASSHVAMISHPGVVTDLILRAAHAVD